jgi:hypothetical protein
MKTRLLAVVPAAACLFFSISLAPLLRAEDPNVVLLRGKAEKGNVLAQYNLGLAYAEGRGVQTDLVEAYAWLRLAAENGGTGTALSGVIRQMSVEQVAAGRMRLDERRHTMPGVVVDRHAATAAAPDRQAAVAPPAPTEDRFAAMQEELSVLRVDNERLTQQLASLQGRPGKQDVSGVTADQKKIADLGAQLETARKELIAALKANEDLAKAQAENQSLAAANQRLEEQSHAAAELPKQLADAQSAIEQLKKENAGLQARNTGLTSQPASVPAPAAAGEADEHARLKDELSRAKSEVQMTLRSFTLLQEENARLKAQLPEAKTP